MKLFSLALLAILFCSSAATAADSSAAVLHCDPGTLIKKIDGSLKAYYNAGNGTSFRECAIPLAPGAHTLTVCYDVVNASAGPVVIGGVCTENREISLDAAAGHSYRLKLGLSKEWSARIEDVTVSEAGVSYEKLPARPKTGSKKDRETILVLQAIPEYAYLTLQKGEPEGKWFMRGVTGGLRPFDASAKGVPNGFHVVRAHAGDSIGVTYGRLQTGSIFIPKFVVPCGDFQTRVYEDLPAAKVLYLGRLSITDYALGYVGHYGDDIEAARNYLKAHYPEYADRLEPANFRLMRSTELCRGQGADLTDTPLGFDP